MGSPRMWYSYHPLPPLSIEWMQRQYYRPTIQGMITRYQTLRKLALTGAPDAKGAFANFVSEETQNVVAILEAEVELKKWADSQDQLRERKAHLELQKWLNMYRDELIALGYDQIDADVAISRRAFNVKLEAGWVTNRVFFEGAASQIKCFRLFRARSSTFHTVCGEFIAQQKRNAPIRGLLPSSIRKKTFATGSYQPYRGLRALPDLYIDPGRPW